jgi:hypothetical protein
MTLPTGESPISFSQIRTEFGDGTNTSTSPVRLGQYRSTDASFTNEAVGALSNLPLDTGIPTSGTINVDVFHGKKLNVIIDYYSGSTENRPNVARTKYQAASASGNRVVVGGYKDRVINDSSGSKVIIHVNKTIGSSNASVNTCAVRTGTGWESGTDLSIEIGGSGKIYGAGGNGGNGSTGKDGAGNGGTGSSALGISYNGTVVNLKSGALIRQGYGGGGGGGGANGVEEAGGEDSLFLEHIGSGGGGGAGVPGGTGGTVSSPDGGTGTPNVGGNGSTDSAGAGGAAGNDRTFGGQGGYAGGGKGGDGADTEQSAQNGNPGEAGGGEWQSGPSIGSGGSAGGNGAAIRKASGVSWSFGTNSGTVTGEGAGGSGESPTGVS